MGIAKRPAKLGLYYAQAVSRFDRKFKSTDGEIDKLVYELYGLSEEEIGMVERE